jgi:hypothetical protein
MDSCKSCNESLVSMKGGEFLDQLKEDCYMEYIIKYMHPPRPNGLSFKFSMTAACSDMKCKASASMQDHFTIPTIDHRYLRQ